MRIYGNRIIGQLVKFVQMGLQVLVVQEMPPLTARAADTMIWSEAFIAVFITKPVETGFRVVQTWVEHEAQSAPEVAAGRD